MNDYDPIIQRIDREAAEKHERLRQVLYEHGRPDLVAELDAKMRAIANGVDGAQRTWHSISTAQRRTLKIIGAGRRLIRTNYSRHFYNAVGEPHIVEKAAGLLTVRNLCSRELLAWDGGAFDPESAAVITERGLFVLKYGPLTQTQTASLPRP